MNICMSIDEKKIFLQNLQKGGIYFEFGSGGSTVEACKINEIKKIISVESDQLWIDKIPKNDKLSFIYIDIGIVISLGYPKDKSKIENWSNYSLAIKDYKPDIVLVDGRFRGACICQSILNLNKDGIIIVHDFWNRPHYHIVLKFLDNIQRIDTLAIFKIKSDIITDEVLKVWNEYKLITF